MSKALRCKPSAVIGLRNDFIAYAFDSAVVRWGTAFDSAVSNAVAEAKTREKAEQAAQRVVRRWIPESRKYAELKR
jgi:hypothetical protein